MAEGAFGSSSRGYRWRRGKTLWTEKEKSKSMKHSRKSRRVSVPNPFERAQFGKKQVEANWNMELGGGGRQDKRKDSPFRGAIAGR